MKETVLQAIWPKETFTDKMVKVAQFLITLVAECNDILEEEIVGKVANGQDNLEKDLGLDVFDIIDIAISSEVKFGIMIPEEICETFETLTGVIRYVNGQVK